MERISRWVSVVGETAAVIENLSGLRRHWLNYAHFIQSSAKRQIMLGNPCCYCGRGCGLWIRVLMGWLGAAGRPAQSRKFGVYSQGCAWRLVSCTVAHTLPELLLL